MRLPVHIVGDKEIVIAGAVRSSPVLAAVENAELAAEVFKLRAPCFDAVVGNVRVSADEVINIFRLHRQMEHWMSFAERYHIFYKFVNIPVCLQLMPVEPGNLIVLTVSIIVAVLGIAELIAR